MADNIPLSISWSTINDYFMCPVCMSDFRDTLVTRCGHRYCATCIRECIDIHHKCPCCNKVLSPDDLIKDHQIDELLLILSKDHDPIVKMLSPVGHVLKELNQRIERLRNGHRTQTELLEKDLEIIGNQLAESFDNYLDEHIPDLSIIPVNITLSILNKSLQLANVTIKPRHRPSARRDLYEMHRIAEDIVERGASHKDIIVLPSDCLPVLHYHLQPGSEIAIFGQVVCESDLPKRCFAVTYKSENPSAIDYFTCKDCKINCHAVTAPRRRNAPFSNRHCIG
ncbi:hypothetical protein LSH36_574g01059 [Paralvinella palmiformis]|uniref:RING-type domain-containing protein n=1 Tax=Paralvinella palmiformis TaxID=53620 RepID=A0AAD9J5U0_9ANNE|nr:hypothetical protein LSH36_574g01059 [Paralvinella palmiformis]